MYKIYTKNMGMSFRYARKLTLIMRFTAIILTAMIMQVSATTLGQSITLNTRNASLSSIIKEIREQSGYDFFYNKELIKKTGPISLNVKNAGIQEVLDQCLEGQPLTYKIENKVVMLKEKPYSFVEKVQDFFGLAVDVRGTVTDSTGLPLPGASVRIKGGNSSTITDGNGNFRLPDVEVGQTLEITFIGFITREVLVTRENAASLSIILRVDIGKLQEVSVVTTGYQTIAKERSAGSFAQADMEVVSNRTTSMNILQSLDGLMPGLVVNNAPQRNQILVRGLSTTGAPHLVTPNYYQGSSPQPLYVVDGIVVPFDDSENPLTNNPLASINPQDVKDVTLLKDATAASIWGARATNGVILITTKRGGFNTKLRVNYNGFVNFQGKPELDWDPLLNSQQFISTAKELFNTPGYQAQFPYSVVSGFLGGGVPPHEQILYNQSLGLISDAQAQKSLDSLAGISNRGQISDLFYRDALLSNQTLSLTGGGDKYSFYGSTSYTNTVDNVPGSKNNTYKINLRQDIKVNDFLRFHILTDLSNNSSSAKRNLDIDYNFNTYQLFQDASGNSMSVPFMTGLPEASLADIQARSRMSMDYNPLEEFDNGYTQRKALLGRLNTGVSLNIIKGLRFEGNYGYMKGANNQREFESLESYLVRKEIAQFTINPTATSTPQYLLPTNGGRLTTGTGDQRSWTIRNQFIYDNTWNKHELTVLGGQEAMEQFNTNQTNRVRGFDEILLTSGAMDAKALTGLTQNTVYPNYSTFGSILPYDAFSTNEKTTRFTSYYGNLGYTYNRKYSFNGSWRIDQSNLFGKDKTAQNKPVWSTGARWNISNENFMQSVNWIDRLSLRLTYGITGNSPNVGVAASEDITAPYGSAFFPGGIGMRITTPGNDKLSWESTRTLNFGVDVSVLRDRLSGSIDLYRKKTSGLLGLIYPNTLTGWPAIVGNQGDLSNKGVEFNIQSANFMTRNFQWTTNLVFAHNINNIEHLTSNAPITTGAQRVVSAMVEGYPAFTQFAYNYAGLDNTGAPLVRLADGTVTKDRLITKPEDIVFMGTYQPVWNGGLSNSFRYKNVRLSANMIYNMGHVMKRERNLYFSGQLRRNVSADFLNRWMVPGDESQTDIPGYVTNSDPNASLANYDYFRLGSNNVVDASFIKLRDITLFYDLPKFLVSKINAQGVTFRIQGSNFMVWKANKVGIDPEFQGLAIPSNQHTITLGANIAL